MKSSGVNAVLPGSMRTRSMPSSRNIGQSRSTSSQAMNSVPSETEGAARLAAKATAKWPMNTRSGRPEERFLHVGRDRPFAEPDPQKRGKEIIAGNLLRLDRAVDEQRRAGARRKVQHDRRAFLRLADALDRREQRFDLRL